MNDSRLRTAALGSDLVLVAIAVLVSAGLLLAGVSGPVAWLIGIPLLLVWPGYAVVAALLPEAPGDEESPTADGSHGTARGRQRPPAPGWTARIGLSLLLSAVVVAVTGIAVSWLLTLRLGPVVAALTVVTLGSLAVAARRRRRLPKAARANPLDGTKLRRNDASSGSLGSTRQARTLAVATLLLIGTVAFVAAAPPQTDGYTESYLLTENDDGDLVAEGYPTTFVAGEGHPLAVGLENHEQRPVTYTVDIVAERVGPNGSVASQQRVDRFSVDLAHNETTVVERQVAPTVTGDTVRLQTRVYKTAEPPASATPDQTTQLWIEVVGSAGA